MIIENNILKYYLRNVFFITGTAYAGKSTTVKMLSERYDMIMCGENYHNEVTDAIADPAVQPDLCYMKQMKSWEDFVRRSPEEYERWIYGVGEEVAGFEVAELIALSQNKKVIVDTNIPLEILHQISDYNHVAVMLSPQSMSVERFFDRDDPEKQFILSVIEGYAAKAVDSSEWLFKEIKTRMPYGVFLDVHFPNENGLDILKRLKEEYPDIHVVMLTADMSEETHDTALEYGAEYFIYKPFPTEHFHEAMKAIL